MERTLGVARCIELLTDLPDYFRSVHGGAPTGFSDFAPAVKAQLGPPSRRCCAVRDSRSGHRHRGEPDYNPHVQFPWSREVGGDWGLSGMFTQFWFPGQPKERCDLRSDVCRRARSWRPRRPRSSNTLAIIRTTTDRAKSSTPAVPIGLPLLSKSIFMQGLD